jgi:hypothetical protein
VAPSLRTNEFKHLAAGQLPQPLPPAVEKSWAAIIARRRGRDGGVRQELAAWVTATRLVPSGVSFAKTRTPPGVTDGVSRTLIAIIRDR